MAGHKVEYPHIAQSILKFAQRFFPDGSTAWENLLPHNPDKISGRAVPIRSIESPFRENQ